MNTPNYHSFVDPFWGNGATQSLPLEGMGRGWNWLKAQTGNTHPGATRPFGGVSACPFSGAYPSGYGKNGCSSNGPAPEVFDRKAAWGITHFHLSGTGYMGFFYNYFLFTPSVPTADTRHIAQLKNEVAHPGFYSGTLQEYGVDFQLTTTQCAACHRYAFKAQKGRLAVETKNMGLRLAMGTRYKEEIFWEDVKRDDPANWHGYIVARGTTIYFALKVKADIADAANYNGSIEFDFDSNTAEAYIGFSITSQQQATQRAQEAFDQGFDAVRQDAKAEWTDQLSRIRADFSSSAEQKRFYSTLYHSLVKPSWHLDTFTDFQTMWDIYRTQLPLALSLSPKIARRLLLFMVETIESIGNFPISFSMDDNRLHECNQACALVVYTLADGFFRNILTHEDYPRLKAALQKEFSYAHVADKSPTHTLDLAGAFNAAALIAHACGDSAAENDFTAKAAIWKNVYDTTTGYLVKDAVYYEGNYRNYSFRPHTGMAERIQIAGGTSRFNDMLDDFFTVGFTPNDDADPCAEQRPIREGYFEAMNNESDMETPYTYLWCGRTDRLAQISDIIRRCQFVDGEGGAPGNVDSGALSSWYVWSCLGIYPLTGTPYYLLGSPSISHAEVDLAQGTLVIDVRRQSPKSIYPVAYTFNGKTSTEPWLPIAELEKGGSLVFELADQPAAPAPIPDWL